ncbi:peptidylprolyl isomerase [uncultured Bacteroides sp.]|uniref:peptidylprolyl isomerase n=1 Tax=uncultured Bacteroides sp. TaxID=162156 RepID=UPI002AAC340C|nr:peptidylprolyl isomerase [uncultured Bacteroides sp.]
MKREIILFAGLAFGACAFSQQKDEVLMKINNKNITRSEFEYIYNKNNSNNELDKKSLEEYVNLFVNFKLKVAAAESEGVDTTKAFRDEFLGYRQQLAKSYLTDDSVDQANALVIYNRLKENLETSHILFRCKPDATPGDSLDAYNKAERARQRILSGESFEKVAREVSEDSSVKQNGGNLGYFTALQMVSPFEDAAYSLKTGEVSKPVRTDFGYHIIKVTNRRPDMGKVQVAHIFKSLLQDVTKEQENRATMQMDSIYKALQNGADFAALAKNFSDDKGTASRGGELPWIGFRQTVKEFENVVFSLNKGEISNPFRSPSGLHIVKLIDRKPIESFEEKKEEIIRRMNRQGRGNKGVEAFVEKLKTEYKFSYNDKGVNEIKSLMKNIQAGKDSLTSAHSLNLSGDLFTLNGTNYPVKGFIIWAMTQHGTAEKQLKDYTNNFILNYENGQLEQKYPEFGHLMQEYRDGILLFDVSNRKVWDKASKDEKGLAAFFQENSSSYKWDSPRFKGVIAHCKDKKTAKAVKKLTKNNSEEEWATVIRKAFNNDSVSLVKVEKGLFAKGSNKYVDKLKFKSGNPEPLKDYPVTIVLGKMLKGGPESYKDVRGPVTADYQNYLEADWIKELREKYKVEINQQILKTVNNH